MSKNVPFECTESSVNDNINITVMGPTCQMDRLCPDEVANTEIPVFAEVLKSIEGTKVYPHPVERDKKGNVTRKMLQSKREDSETEK